MFPDLEYADSLENPDAARRWPRQRIALMFAGLIAAGVASVAFTLLNDSSLEPWSDLEPAATTTTPGPPPAENGYVFLRKKWKNPSYANQGNSNQAGAIAGGSWLWDDELAATVLKGNGNLREDLRAALKMPHWQVESPGTDTDWQRQCVNVLLLEGMGASRSGGIEPELDLLADVQELSTRSLAAGGPWRTALVIRQQIAARCCGLLSSGRIDAGAFTRLSALWDSQEPLTRTWLTARFLEEVSSMRGNILAEDGEVDAVLSRWPKPKLRRLLFKPNRALNHYHAAARRLLEGLTALPENLEGAVADLNLDISGGPAGDEITEWFQPGAGVERVGVRRLAQLRNGIASEGLFFTRAMRVRLALYRWQQDHAGALPAGLEQLVPAYLLSIPADPWSGHPLLWDGGKEGILYAVGIDGVANLPSFSSGMWVESDWTSPGLRLNPPTPKPRPVKTAPKFKKPPPAPKPVPVPSSSLSPVAGEAGSPGPQPTGLPAQDRRAQ